MHASAGGRCNWSTASCCMRNNKMTARIVRRACTTSSGSPLSSASTLGSCAAFIVLLIRWHRSACTPLCLVQRTDAHRLLSRHVGLHALLQPRRLRWRWQGAGLIAAGSCKVVPQWGGEEARTSSTLPQTRTPPRAAAAVGSAMCAVCSVVTTRSRSGAHSNWSAHRVIRFTCTGLTNCDVRRSMHQLIPLIMVAFME